MSWPCLVRWDDSPPGHREILCVQVTSDARAGPLMAGKRQTEKVLGASSLPFEIVRPDMFQASVPRPPERRLCAVSDLEVQRGSGVIDRDTW